MPEPTLQDAIDQAGSPIRLLWKPEPPAWRPPVLPEEFVGWRKEQTANFETAALADLSHHMDDTFLHGADATKLLSENSVNNYDRFVVGQAKQLIAVTKRGLLINDCIVTKEGEDSYTLVGLPLAQTWIRYRAEAGGYDVGIKTDPNTARRGGRGGDPVLFRFQIQGPNAMEITQSAFDNPIPETKFFHLADVSLNGRRFRALRHGMAGQPGFEFIGDYADGEFVREALLKAGEPLGLVQVGAKAYPTTGVESGWLAAPPPAIYSDPELKPYREWLSAYSFEGNFPFLSGSFFSEDIDDYYVSPLEVGYDRMISFDHDFIGRDALIASKDSVSRTKVTLEVAADEIASELGPDFDFQASHAKNRVELDGERVGLTFFLNFVDRLGTILALAVVDNAYASVGTELTLIWGSHPGHTASEAPGDFRTLRCRVVPTPYNEYARAAYRSNV
jgi:vanillate/3-O-methylgallate O-demethylase